MGQSFQGLRPPQPVTPSSSFFASGPLRAYICLDTPPGNDLRCRLTQRVYGRTLGESWLV